MLAEAATAHPDGTVSMLRAGITRVQTSQMPMPLRLSLVASIAAEPSERGKHTLEMNCIDEDGNDRLPAISLQFETPPTGGTNHLIIAINKKLSEFGVYQFNLVIDREQKASCTLQVAKIGATDGNSPA